MANTKKILSFDVGIKNLAYCIIEKDLTQEDFKIITWGIINLAGPTTKCDFVMKSGQCTSPAKMQIYHKDKILINGKESINCCAAHSKKLVPTVIELKKANLHSCSTCTSNAFFHLANTNVYWCLQHYRENGNKILKGIKTKKIFVKNANRESVQDLCTRMYAQFNAHPTFLTVDEVLIENQPSMTNPTMKTMSSFVFGYFIMKKPDSSINGVHFISPSNKLKVLEDDGEKKNKKIERSYKMTKNLGIKYCSALIGEEDKAFLMKFKKKDDMCDAFLQGFQYLFRPVPIKYIKKLEVVGFDSDKVGVSGGDVINVSGGDVINVSGGDVINVSGGNDKMHVSNKVKKSGRKGRPVGSKVIKNDVINVSEEINSDVINVSEEINSKNSKQVKKQRGRPKMK